MRWSIPRRRLGDRFLTTIPEDIYRLIFDYIQPFEDVAEYKEHLSNLTLVCRFFLISFVPLLFRSVNFGGTKGVEFYTGIVGNREPARSLGVFVKHCSFAGQALLAPRHPSEGLRLLRGIESLSLTRFPLNSNLFDAISGLSSLKSLSITDFTIDPNLSFPPDFYLKLTSFTLLDYFSRSSNHVAESLLAFIGLATLRVLETDDPGLLCVLANQSQDLRIEELNVRYHELPDLQTLYKAFSRMPNLTSLSLSVVFPSLNPSWPLPPLSLPNLKALSCPTFLASQLIPGRPLKYVHLTSDLSFRSRGFSITESRRLFTVLRQSIAPIESLNVPIDIYSASSFGEALPHLKTLCLRYPPPPMGSSSIDHFTENVTTLCQHGLTLPPITNLHLDFAVSPPNSKWLLNFTLQNQMVSFLHQVICPTLQRISFINGLEWVLQKIHGPIWQPYVSRSLCRELERLDPMSAVVLDDYSQDQP